MSWFSAQHGIFLVFLPAFFSNSVVFTVGTSLSFFHALFSTQHGVRTSVFFSVVFTIGTSLFFFRVWFSTQHGVLLGFFFSIFVIVYFSTPVIPSPFTCKVFHLHFLMLFRLLDCGGQSIFNELFSNAYNLPPPCALVIVHKMEVSGFSFWHFVFSYHQSSHMGPHRVEFVNDGGGSDIRCHKMMPLVKTVHLTFIRQ